MPRRLKKIYESKKWICLATNDLCYQEWMSKDRIDIIDVIRRFRDAYTRTDKDTDT